jgi:GxxExxY protein
MVFGRRKADFIVDNQIVVKVKGIIGLENVRLAQAKKYVKAYNLPIGLLINFGNRSF